MGAVRGRHGYSAGGTSDKASAAEAGKGEMKGLNTINSTGRPMRGRSGEAGTAGKSIWIYQACWQSDFRNGSNSFLRSCAGGRRLSTLTHAITRMPHHHTATRGNLWGSQPFISLKRGRRRAGREGRQPPVACRRPRGGRCRLRVWVGNHRLWDRGLCGLGLRLGCLLWRRGRGGGRGGAVGGKHLGSALGPSMAFEAAPPMPA